MKHQPVQKDKVTRRKVLISASCVVSAVPDVNVCVVIQDCLIYSSEGMMDGWAYTSCSDVENVSACIALRSNAV